MKTSPQVAVPSAGVGGASAAALLEQEGFSVRVCEQAPAECDAFNAPFVVPVNEA